MLTKAFVVLVTIVSVLITALFAAFAAQTGELRGRITTLEQQTRESRASAQHAQENYERVQTINRQLETAENTEIAALTDQVEELQRQLETAESDLADAKARNDRLNTSLTGLDESNAQFATLFDLQHNQLTSLYENDAEQRNRLIDRADRIAELESEQEALVSQVNRLKEQTVAYQRENERLERQLDLVPDEVLATIDGGGDGQQASVYVYPDVKIYGEVVIVRGEGENALVAVNVGSRDRVERNMPFMISRNGQFIGELLIGEVRPDQAIGELTFISGEVQQVQQGDQVVAMPKTAWTGVQ